MPVTFEFDAALVSGEEHLSDAALSCEREARHYLMQRRPLKALGWYVLAAELRSGKLGEVATRDRKERVP